MRPCPSARGRCQHGPTKLIIDDVLPLLRKYRASGYIAGHDHCSAHYEETYEEGGAVHALVEDGAAALAEEGGAARAHDEAARMLFVVAGAGKECCYAPWHLHSRLNPGPPLFRMDKGMEHSAIGGFASYVVTAEATTVRYHDHDGSVLYTAAPLPPRTKRGRA